VCRYVITGDELPDIIEEDVLMKCRARSKYKKPEAMEILRKSDGLNMESESLLKLVDDKCPYLMSEEQPQERAPIIKKLLKQYAGSIELMNNVNDQVYVAAKKPNGKKRKRTSNSRGKGCDDDDDDDDEEEDEEAADTKRGAGGEVFNTSDCDGIFVMNDVSNGIKQSICMNFEHCPWNYTEGGTKHFDRQVQLTQKYAAIYDKYHQVIFDEKIQNRQLFIRLMYYCARGFVQTYMDNEQGLNKLNVVWLEIGELARDLCIKTFMKIFTIYRIAYCACCKQIRKRHSFLQKSLAYSQLPSI